MHVGAYSVPVPNGLDTSEGISIAVRPEDLVIDNSSNGAGSSALWHGTIDQSIDLGHYRKVLVIVPGLFPDENAAIAHRVKLYLPKSADVHEGEKVSLHPTRYLIYSDQAQPIQIVNKLNRNENENRRDDLSGVAIASEQLRNAG